MLTIQNGAPTYRECFRFVWALSRDSQTDRGRLQPYEWVSKTAYAVVFSVIPIVVAIFVDFDQGALRSLIVFTALSAIFALAAAILIPLLLLTWLRKR